MSRVSDVVVVGGGVIGLAVAYYLLREKVPVTLVERGLLGRETSWAAAGYLLLKEMILGQASTLPTEPYQMARLLIGESLPRPVTGGRHVRQR
jgi:2-polyprenyl-6-methoxyphenol hydroxylase-like FAD-dependent oxidoreductase